MIIPAILRVANLMTLTITANREQTAPLFVVDN